MELTYYTTDDLALPAKGVIRKRQAIAHFDTLAEALRHFQSLGPSMHKSLGLFGPEQCLPDSRSELDYAGKVLVLSPDTLRESCWSQENQLWYAHDGFGCSPHAIGRSIRCTCLGDGEHTRWNRADFIGVLKDEFLPDWAKEKLEQLSATGHLREAPSMSGMSM